MEFMEYRKVYNEHVDLAPSRLFASLLFSSFYGLDYTSFYPLCTCEVFEISVLR